MAEAQEQAYSLIETPTRWGAWGHPDRQLGLDACRGEFIGLSNDDNYYVPGYLEQMVLALKDADLAMCQIVHSYAGWARGESRRGRRPWIRRASPARKVRWPGNHFLADDEYLKALTTLAQGRVVEVDRPLFVHN